MNAIITGGTKGIGLAIAKKLASMGINLAICSRSESDLEATREHLSEACKVSVYAHVVDVSDKAAILRFAQACIEELSSIDILINNAGIFIPGKLQDEAEGQLEQMMATNLYSAYHLSRAIIPTMKAQKKGHIFNICSVASLKAYDNGGSYSISKYALSGFNHNLRHELKEENIKVTGVYPGATWSDSWAGIELPQDRLMEASDIATMVASCIELSSSATVEDIIMRPQLGDL